MSSNEELPFGIDHDYSAIGTFEVESQLQKGQEVKTRLRQVLDDVVAELLTKQDVNTEISINDNLRLVVIPRFPVDKVQGGIDQQVIEPFVVRNVTGEIEYEDEDQPSIILTGQSDSDEDGPDTFFKFDPLAGHDIIARAVDGNYTNGGVRVTSGEAEPTLRLEVY